MERFEIFPLKVIRPLVLIGLLGFPRMGAPTRVLFNYLDHAGIRTCLLAEGPDDGDGRNLVVAITEQDLARCEADLDPLRLAMSAQAVVIERPVAVIRVLGPHFDVLPGVAGLLFSELTKSGIRVLACSTTITTTLLAVPEEQADKVVRNLERIFHLPGRK
jgi:aspartokinase